MTNALGTRMGEVVVVIREGCVYCNGIPAGSAAAWRKLMAQSEMILNPEQARYRDLKQAYRFLQLSGATDPESLEAGRQMVQEMEKIWTQFTPGEREWAGELK